MRPVIKYISTCFAIGGLIIFGRAFVDHPRRGTIANTVIPTPLPTDGASPTPHPASLMALQNRQPNGSDFVLGQLLTENQYYQRHFITYESDTIKISGIMNIPKGNGPFPVLILNHGYIDPGEYTNGRGLKREQDYFARHGYVVVHPDYRNHAESDRITDSEVGFRSGYTEDVINAIDALKHANLPLIDTSRIGMLGHSMGGGIALNVIVTKPDLIRSVVLFAPVSSDMRDNYLRWMIPNAEAKEAVESEFGRPESNPALWDSLSASTFLDSVAVPVLIHHGTSDDSVPLAWSEKLAETLKQNEKNVTLFIYPGEAHEFGPSWSQVMERSVRFFDQTVKNK